jgi:putative ABC transport system ATP-binding protein
MSVVSLKNVSKRFHRGAESVDVLSALDLDIPANAFVALMGPSGSGKSTLLNIIGGLDRPDDGVVAVAGVRIDGLAESQLARWRARHVGFVFQFYNLMPELRAEQNVELPLLLTGLSPGERRDRAEMALELVGLSERRRHRPAELSGGQQQRVAIARAIVVDPTVLVCDEPTGDLDRRTADEVLSLLTLLNREHGKAIVMVTHDPKAAGYADRILEIDKGQLVEAERRMLA